MNRGITKCEGRTAAFQAEDRGVRLSNPAPLLLAVFLAGCQTVPVQRTAPDVHIAPECLTACALEMPVIDGTAQSIADGLVAERARLKQCENKRLLCVSALKRARDAGAIK